MGKRGLTRESAWSASTGTVRKGSIMTWSQSGRPQSPPLMKVGATTPSSMDRFSCSRGLDSKATSSAQLSSTPPHVRRFASILKLWSPSGPPVGWVLICSTVQYGHGNFVKLFACLWQRSFARCGESETQRRGPPRKKN